MSSSLYDAQLQLSSLQEAQRQIQNMGAVLDRLEAEAEGEACDHAQCFGALSVLLEAIDTEITQALSSLQREAEEMP
jgi:hypothetical protein